MHSLCTVWQSLDTVCKLVQPTLVASIVRWQKLQNDKNYALLNMTYILKTIKNISKISNNEHTRWNANVSAYASKKKKLHFHTNFCQISRNILWHQNNKKMHKMTLFFLTESVSCVNWLFNNNDMNKRKCKYLGWNANDSMFAILCCLQAAKITFSYNVI